VLRQNADADLPGCHADSEGENDRSLINVGHQNPTAQPGADCQIEFQLIHIIAWKLCTTMKAQDVTATLDLALAASGCDQVRIVHKPRLLSDNGSSYVSAELADWLTAQSIGHVRGAPYHPQTQGKIERWHQTLKNRILLEHYYLPGDLEASIGRFVDHYNHRRYHESLSNLTPADVYFGRGQTILLERERIKRNTIQKRRLQHQREAA
jgi:putative transposase